MEYIKEIDNMISLEILKSKDKIKKLEKKKEIIKNDIKIEFINDKINQLYDKINQLYDLQYINKNINRYIGL